VFLVNRPLTTVFLVLLNLLCLVLNSAQADVAPYRKGELLVRFKEEARHPGRDKQKQILSVMGVEFLKHFSLNDIYLVRSGREETVEALLKRFRARDDVDVVEPNYLRHVHALPNDPKYALQYAHEIIKSAEAWDLETGDRSVVVGVVDTGIDYDHEDLKDNLWKNQGEDWFGDMPGNNGIDDDNDGYVDNYYGINTIVSSGDPYDDEEHGTHVSGIISAEGNNHKGVVGMNWRVSIAGLKFIGSDGYGSIGDEIEAIEFAQQKGFKILNLSFGDLQYSIQERDAIANASNILFIASAGNESADNDVVPLYPASYDLSNVISVTSSSQFDSLSWFANHGRTSVHVAAPGQSILSTLPGQSYDIVSGSSMSAAFVSGLAALILANKSSFTALAIKDQILRAVDVIPELEGRVLTGGRINAYRSLTTTVEGPYIYAVSPPSGAANREITLIGSRFLDRPGQVLFPAGLEASIVSWTNEKIVCQVPSEAQSGPLFVRTVEGDSNEVTFNLVENPDKIIPSPGMMNICFPHASTEPGEEYYLSLSNLQHRAILVSAKVVGISGDNTMRFFTMKPNDRLFIELRSFGVLNENVFIECKSEDSFGASLMRFDSDSRQVSFEYPIVFKED
jgi:serine protease